MPTDDYRNIPGDDAPPPPQPTIALRFQIPAAWMAVIDEQRGDIPRAAWIRSILLRVLRLRGAKGLRDDISDRPSQRSRPADQVSLAERRRRRHAAAQRRYRSMLAYRLARRAADRDIVFTVTTDDTILASDLDGHLAGIIYRDGGLASESRHRTERLLRAVRQHHDDGHPLTPAQRRCLERYHGTEDDHGWTSTHRPL